MTCKNLPKQPADLLINQGWPKSEQEDATLSSMLNYLQEIKSTIRLKHAAALSGGKKAKKVVKGDKPEEPKIVDHLLIFIGNDFPEYQKKVLEILNTFDFKENQIQGDYIGKIRDTIKGKEGGLALKFCAFVVKEAETVGKE